MAQKVNIHAVSACVFLSAVIVMLATFNYTLINMTAILMLSILVTGLVGTSQLVLYYDNEPEVVWEADDDDDIDTESVEREIQPIDIYGGYLIGFVAMAVAIFFMFK